MEQYWLWLSLLDGLSPMGIQRVIAAFGSPEGAYDATEAELCAIETLSEAEKNALRRRSLSDAQKVQQDCEERGIAILTYDDPNYPELLRNIPDPPAVLYYAGDLPDFGEELTIGVVGHRKPSQHGLLMARKLGFELSKSGVVVVSGGALGIDAAAMEGALQGGSPVVGVLGCGVDVDYPKRNRELLKSTRDYGCLLSEYPPGTPALGWHFPVRNRILSGLCRGVVVVEAPRKSGALITARLAQEQGRDVFAVPGNAGMEICAGSNDLLRQGAGCTEFGRDVVEGYEYLYRDRVRALSEAEIEALTMEIPELPDDGNTKIAASCVRIPQSYDKKDVDNTEKRTYIDVHEAVSGLSPEEAAVLQSLGETPVSVDDVIYSSGLSASQVLSALTMLQLRGLCAACPGGRYSLAYQVSKDSEES